MNAPSHHPSRSISIAAILVLGLAVGCSQEGGRSASSLLATGGQESAGAMEPSLAHIAFPFDPSSFVAVVDNPFFPLTPGTVYRYVEETEDGAETNEVEVTHDTKVILGVTAVVVRDRVYLEGALKEDTFDWYAQDMQGNVWYLGEDTKEYEDGVVVSTAGSWEAGKDGAAAGIIMLANPKIGDQYYQENAPGVVEDQGKVLSLKRTVEVPYGTFDECLQTVEWTPIEPGNRAFKYYAAGIGPILEVTPGGGRGRLELIELIVP